ncbi:hypothetical protein A8990_14146 [Paenibacillus taihuensis]|uniref:Uncharacterized protein n=1 Tax=Paenibacillus taihuensis TaxID=1156355 RepID=A0A3D9QUW1_9BACL|nr:hypothetical protein [Paenibacillus taihuensis]REE67685.1 hypothetical protein A8990_14146 [Paenibacillus taihuensis]
MKLRLKWILPSIQIILTIVSVCIDQSIEHGQGEGDNQIIANFVSNIEYPIKQALGYDDIVNYHFRLISVILAVLFWFEIGLLEDIQIRRFRG